VGEDLWDKSQLPGTLQKRRGVFGKKGQSKYTHLTNEDTTDFNPEYKVDEVIQQKHYMLQAGLKA
jgi:microfibrillar-associated protein 1